MDSCVYFNKKLFFLLKKVNLSQAGDSSDLRVEVSAVWKLLNHDGAHMVQQ